MKKKYKLSVNEDQVRKTVRKKEQEVKSINAKLLLILRFFDNDLTDQEIRELKNYNDIVDKFRPEFPYPSAKDSVNFELLGKDTRGLEDASKVLKLISDDYIIKDGKVSLKPEWYENNIERNTRYTQDEYEISVYEYGKKLGELLNTGLKAGYFDRSDIVNLNQGNLFCYLDFNSETYEMKVQNFPNLANSAKRKALKLNKTG